MLISTFIVSDVHCTAHNICSWTLAQPMPLPNYLSGLRSDALAGVRLGIPTSMRNVLGEEIEVLLPAVRVAMDAAIKVLKGLGAIIIDTDIVLDHPHNTYIASADFKAESAIIKYLIEHCLTVSCSCRLLSGSRQASFPCLHGIAT